MQEQGMTEMPSIEDMVKGKVCFGENSQLVEMFKAAKEECGCDGEKEMAEGSMEMEMEEDMDEESSEMAEMDEEKMKKMKSKCIYLPFEVHHQQTF